jgi:hypothetical protein
MDTFVAQDPINCQVHHPLSHLMYQLLMLLPFAVDAVKRWSLQLWIPEPTSINPFVPGF